MTARIAADVYSRTGTLLTHLPASLKRSWQEQRSDAGQGSVSLGLEDPAISSVPYRSIVRLSLDGTVRFAFLVEGRDTVRIAPNDEVDELVTFSGRGVLAILEEAIVYPSGGLVVRSTAGLLSSRLPFSDTRLFSYAAPEFDDSGWGVATIIKAQNDPFDPYSAAPAGWPAPEASWIWGVGGPAPYPVGDCFFRSSFSLASETTVRVFASADDGFQLLIDGAILFSDQQAFGWGSTKQADVFLSAGTHTVAIRGTNIERPTTPATNIAAVIAAVFILNGDGTIGAELLNTDATWPTSAYPIVTPGMTVGRILGLLIDEAQARGALVGLSRDFTDTLDSAGTAWADAGERAYPVGTDYLSVIKSMADDGLADFSIDPATLTLHAFVSMGAVTTIGLAGAGDNLTSLEYTGTI